MHLLGLLRPSQAAGVAQGLTTLRSLSPFGRGHGAAFGTDVISVLGLGNGLADSLVLLGLGRAATARRRRGVGSPRSVRVWIVVLEQIWLVWFRFF